MKKDDETYIINVSVFPESIGDYLTKAHTFKVLYCAVFYKKSLIITKESSTLMTFKNKESFFNELEYGKKNKFSDEFKQIFTNMRYHIKGTKNLE